VLATTTFVGCFSREPLLLLLSPLFGNVVGVHAYRLNMSDSRDLHLSDEELQGQQCRLPVIGILANLFIERQEKRVLAAWHGLAAQVSRNSQPFAVWAANPWHPTGPLQPDSQ
jgi:hypothetical protein